MQLQLDSGVEKMRLLRRCNNTRERNQSELRATSDVRKCIICCPDDE